MKEGDSKKSILDYTYKEFNELKLPYDEMEKLLHQDPDEYEEWRQRHKSEIWEDGKLVANSLKRQVASLIHRNSCWSLDY